MPRRKGKKKKAAETNTYYKAKNGRFYKKIQVDGKTRVRFVSNAEATGAMKLSDSKPSKLTKRRNTKPKKKTEPQPSQQKPDGAESVDEEKE